MSHEDDYEVGYGKPPKANRFKQGQSGNPNGRRKTNKSLATVARELMNEMIDVRINGKVCRITRAEAIMRRQINDATTGTSAERSRALKTLKEYAPDFHLPIPVDNHGPLVIEFVEPDNLVRALDMTDAEQQAMKKWLHERRERKKAGLHASADEPDSLDT